MRHSGLRRRAPPAAPYRGAVDLRITETSIGGMTCLAVEGIVDLASIAQLRDALLRAVQHHQGDVVVVDLDGVVALDDSALGILLGAAAAARDHEGDVHVVANAPALRERLRRTRLDRALTVRDTVA